MVKKIDTLKQHMAAGEWPKALKLAASWPRLGEHKAAIQKAWAAQSNPSFYRQIGQDPDALVAAGINALKNRYC